MRPSYRPVKIVLGLVAALHIIHGLAIVIPGVPSSIVHAFFGASLQVTPQVAHILQIFGIYLLTVGALCIYAIRDPARNPKANPMIMGDFNEGEPVGSRSPSFAGAACNFRIPNWSKLPVGSRLKARSWLASRKSSSAKTWRHSSTRPSQGAGGPTRRFSCGAATPGDRPSRRRHPRRLQGVWSGRQASTGVRPGKGQPLP